ncbi:MAG: hypothetical protein ABH858_06980 [Candidatus Omnitrophota bacterium]
MSLQKIVEAVRTLIVHEERCVSEKYCEFVFENTEIDKLKEVFLPLLGPPEKPAGKDPLNEHLQLTKEYGGIRANQTLFKKDFDHCLVIAMLWPWQNNLYTTLKITLIGK